MPSLISPIKDWLIWRNLCNLVEISPNIIFMEKLIGREAEIQVLKRALASNEAEMVSVIGRRRVGKTFLMLPLH